MYIDKTELANIMSKELTDRGATLGAVQIQNISFEQIFTLHDQTHSTGIIIYDKGNNALYLEFLYDGQRKGGTDVQYDQLTEKYPELMKKAFDTLGVV